MKRIDTMTKEAKAVYIKSLEIAHVYGKSEFECGILECEYCPFIVNDENSCTDEKTEEEWIAWAEEEVK